MVKNPVPGEMNLARAVGLLRMKQRMDQDPSVEKVKVLALAKMIAEVPDDLLAKAQRKVDTDYLLPKLSTHSTSTRTPTWRTKAAPGGLTLTSADLAQYLTDTAGASLGMSSFAKVHEAFVALEAAGTDDERSAQLDALDQRARAWVNDHKGSKRKLDIERADLLSALVDQLAVESARLSKTAAEKRYLGNVVKAGARADYGSDDADERYAFKALTVTSIGAAKKFGKKDDALPFGLTKAEVAAIRIFTGPDFGYVNPAAANSHDYLDANKKNAAADEGSFGRGASDEEMLAEGVVHVGVAMSGLRKLPAYAGDVYRGVAASQAEIDRWKAGGLRFDAMASATTDRGTAESFAKKNTTTDKPFEAIFVIHNAGGRDVQAFSVAAHENEVTLLAGSTYRVTSVKEIKSGGPAKRYEIEAAP